MSCSFDESKVYYVGIDCFEGYLVNIEERCSEAELTKGATCKLHNTQQAASSNTCSVFGSALSRPQQLHVPLLGQRRAFKAPAYRPPAVGLQAQNTGHATNPYQRLTSNSPQEHRAGVGLDSSHVWQHTHREVSSIQTGISALGQHENKRQKLGHERPARQSTDDTQTQRPVTLRTGEVFRPSRPQRNGQAEK